MNKTIIYFGNVFYPDKDAAAHRTIGNGKALRHLGYEVLFVGCKRDEKRKLLDTCEHYEGFDIYYFSEPHSLRQWYDYLIDFKPLKELMQVKSPSYVVLYNHPALSSKRIYNFCQKTGIKVIADCTEWFNPKGFSFHTIIKKVDTYLRMKHVNKQLDGIIAISSFLQKYYQKKGCNTICVPPLVDLKQDKWNKNKDYEAQEEVHLVYVGTPGTGGKDKLDVIIKALCNILKMNTCLKLVFDVIGIDLDYYKAYFDNSFNEEFVHFWGRKSNGEALEYIKKCDFTIFLREPNLVCTAGFPTKFSESLACGTPVLTNITSDLGRYLIEGKNGFVVDVTNFDSICVSIYNALNISKEKRAFMKDFCCSDSSFDYHSFVDVFKHMF